jgi:hypothetical protein
VIGAALALGLGIAFFRGAGPSGATPAPRPPEELLTSAESCAARAGRAPDCVREIAGGLIAYFGDPDARVAW